MTSIRYSRLEKCRSPRLDFQIQAIEPPSLEGLLVPHGNLVAYVLGGIESHGPTDRVGGSVIAVLGLLAILQVPGCSERIITMDTVTGMAMAMTSMVFMTMGTPTTIFGQPISTFLPML